MSRREPTRGSDAVLVVLGLGFVALGLWLSPWELAFWRDSRRLGALAEDRRLAGDLAQWVVLTLVGGGGAAVVLGLKGLLTGK
jgi:hypothetical protein